MVKCSIASSTRLLDSLDDSQIHERPVLSIVLGQLVLFLVQKPIASSPKSSESLYTYSLAPNTNIASLFLFSATQQAVLFP